MPSRLLMGATLGLLQQASKPCLDRLKLLAASAITMAQLQALWRQYTTWHPIFVKAGHFIAFLDSHWELHWLPHF